MTATNENWKPTRFQILEEIRKERSRQIVKGYTWPHDDEHGIGHIINEVERRLKPDDQPWDRDTLVKCAAMLLAAIEAFDRLPANPEVGPRCGACRLGLPSHEPRDPQCVAHEPSGKGSSE
jgi:hypothetical protein